MRRKTNFTGIILGLTVTAFGVTWLGNELNWWAINFPIWPIVIIIIGAILTMSQFGGDIHYYKEE